MKVVVKPDAQADLLQIVEWYRGVDPIIADRFIKSLDASIIQLSQFPLQCPVCLKNVRQFVMKQFPYLILYEPRDETLYIHAVFHASRHKTRLVDRFN